MVLCPHCGEECGAACGRSINRSRRFFLFGSAALAVSSVLPWQKPKAVEVVSGWVAPPRAGGLFVNGTRFASFREAINAHSGVIGNAYIKLEPGCPVFDQREDEHVMNCMIDGRNHENPFAVVFGGAGGMQFQNYIFTKPDAQGLA